MEKVIEKKAKSAETVTVSRSEYEELKAQNAELTGQVKWLMEQMRLVRQKRFGASSEKSEHDQLNLFKLRQLPTAELINRSLLKSKAITARKQRKAVTGCLLICL